jgi:hypothetical protein
LAAQNLLDLVGGGGGQGAGDGGGWMKIIVRYSRFTPRRYLGPRYSRRKPYSQHEYINNPCPLWPTFLRYRGMDGSRGREFNTWVSRAFEALNGKNVRKVEGRPWTNNRFSINKKCLPFPFGLKFFISIWQILSKYTKNCNVQLTSNHFFRFADSRGDRNLNQFFGHFIEPKINIYRWPTWIGNWALAFT